VNCSLNLVYSRYKEECHTIASQSETKMNELKGKIDHLHARNTQLQSDMADIQRKDAEVR
jgi:outer membrane murein-binding lipoprotein Lpp